MRFTSKSLVGQLGRSRLFQILVGLGTYIIEFPLHTEPRFGKSEKQAAVSAPTPRSSQLLEEAL